MSLVAYAALLLALLVNLLILYWAFTHVRDHGIKLSLIGVGLMGVMSIPIFYVTLRTLLMRLPAPKGSAITRNQAPILFDVLDKMRVKLNGPPIHHVLVDKDYNACIMQLPRWGLVGASVNYLVVGLPFMFGQSTSEMMSVVAHEYGHLCGAHGRLHAWVYRQRITLGAIHARVEAYEEASVWHALMAKSLRAFMPYFNAYTFVLSRQHEYEADRTAAKLTGEEAASCSLIRSSLLVNWFHHDFWPTLYRQANTHARPAFMPYKSMGTAFRMSYDEWATAERLKVEWQRESDVDDTHPSLRERVEALGQRPRLPPPLTRSASITLLGTLGDRLAEEFDRQWWADQAKDWSERYRHVTRSQARLRALDAADLASLPLHELQEVALLKAEFLSPDAAKPALEHLLRQPGGPFPMASYVYGRILLNERRRDGLDYLAAAARHDKRLTQDALHAGYMYLLERDGDERAQAWCEAVSEVQPA